MSTVYLVQQGGVVTKSQGRFQIKAGDEPQQDIPVREISKMLLYGNIHLTTPVISTCLHEQIPVFFLSRSGKYKGHLWSVQSGELTAELAQFSRYGDEAFRLEMARAIVRGKLLNSKQLLLRRSRRPPTDPINALLSFGYTLLYNNVLSFILVEGLNPYLGSLHRSERKETHLAFDLMEAFRSPVVDSMILRLVNQRIIKLEDFQPSAKDGGIYLKEGARRVFLKWFETRMDTFTAYPDRQDPVTYRRAIQLQVQDYKRAMMAAVPYAPFLRAV